MRREVFQATTMQFIKNNGQLLNTNKVVATNINYYSNKGKEIFYLTNEYKVAFRRFKYQEDSSVNLTHVDLIFSERNQSDQELNSIEVFDLTGRIVYYDNAVNNTNDQIAIKLNPSAYLLKTINKDGSFSSVKFLAY